MIEKDYFHLSGLHAHYQRIATIDKEADSLPAGCSCGLCLYLLGENQNKSSQADFRRQSHEKGTRALPLTAPSKTPWQSPRSPNALAVFRKPA
jgi:hypothetical protein